MYGKQILEAEELPIHEHSRKFTDVSCCFTAVAFGLAMLIAAFLHCSWDSFWCKMDPCSQLRSQQCPRKQADTLFMAGFGDLSSCAADCTCPGFIFQSGRIPGYLEQSKSLSTEKSNFSGNVVGLFSAVAYITLITISFALFWLVLVQLFPSQGPIGTSCLAIALTILLNLNGYFQLLPLPFSPYLGLFLAALGLLLTVNLLCYFKQSQYSGVMVLYSSAFLAEQPKVLLNVVLFWAGAILLTALCVYQHCCFFSSAGTWDIFDLPSCGILGLLNAAQLLWGLQFLKDGFCFCVSGSTTIWFWQNQKKCILPCQRLLFRNLGSIFAGSFLNCFLFLPCLCFSMLLCLPVGQCPCAGGDSNRSKCCSLTGIVRTDVYTYINLTGIPFCNAGRQCEKLCHSNPLIVGTLNPLNNYCLITKLFCLTAVGTMSLLVLEHHMPMYGLQQFVAVLLVVDLIVSPLISLHPNVAESLSINVMAQRWLCKSTYEHVASDIVRYLDDLE